MSTAYSPEKRTALVFCGSGAHGAYHAGALRAVQEAGVKVDVVAGHGIGAATAVLAAIDGGARLWEEGGLWRQPQVSGFYRWRWPLGGGSRRTKGSGWWRLLGSPLDPAGARKAVAAAVWQLIRGAGAPEPPAANLFGRRYTEVVAENLGQPGFRELMVLATDLDTRRDVIGALLRDTYRNEFMAPRPGRDRRGEVLDLAGAGRDHAIDLVFGAIAPPVGSDPSLITFAPDSFWRGETHRLCDRPGSVARLLEELSAAGVSQVIVISAVTPASEPHRLASAPLDVRRRVGDAIAAAEAAGLRDAIENARLRFEAIYPVCPGHNPIGPFDLDGAYDEASDRRHTLLELMERGYEDAYHQFIEPVVGASGEEVTREHDYRLR